MATIYDTGALIAAERNERQMWLSHRIRLEAGDMPRVPAAVVAQASRSPRQVQLRRILRGCHVIELDELRAHRCGVLLAASGTTDVVDAAVVEVADSHGDTIVTSDPRDIRRLCDARGLRNVLIAP